MSLVSYIVPVFNKERFIATVLECIDAQEGDFAREIIVIDDGSSDGGTAILAELSKGRSDMLVLRQEDLGPAVAINRAARLAKGDYFKFVDGDDLLVPNATALLIAALETSGAVLACGDCAEYDSALLPHVPMPPRSSPPVRRIDNPLAFLFDRIGLTMSGTMVRAEAFRKVGGCDERVFVHDAPLFLRLANFGTFALIEGPVALMPTADPQRWSNRAQGQVLHDVNAASAFFLAEHEKIPPAMRKLALRRALGRAWKYAHRRGTPAPWRYLLLNILGRVPLPWNEARLIEISCHAFREAVPVRVPDATVGA